MHLRGKPQTLQTHLFSERDIYQQLPGTYLVTDGAQGAHVAQITQTASLVHWGDVVSLPDVPLHAVVHQPGHRVLAPASSPVGGGSKQPLVPELLPLVGAILYQPAEDVSEKETLSGSINAAWYRRKGGEAVHLLGSFHRES